MYRLDLDNGKQLHVRYKTHTVSYSMDGSLPNPLEATYAALAGCAGVYSHKACKALGISAEGIRINCKPVVQSVNPLVPARFVTEVNFPEHVSTDQRQHILKAIGHCAVKELIHDGAQIEFLTREAA